MLSPPHPACRLRSEPGVSPRRATLQEVVVTAQKREEKLHDVPMGVTAITAEELQKQQLVSLEDLQSKVPGLSLTNVEPGITRLTLRGQNVGGVGSTVTTYIDDTPFGSSNALANGFGFTGDFDTWDLQRVEVLRGPQGTLYGAGSEGGLLKYVTNPPDPTKFAAAVQAGGEDVAHGEAGGSGKGMINLPIGDRAAFRLSGYYERLPGYIDDPSLGEKDINHGDRDGVRASLLVNFTDNLSIRLNAFGQDLHTDGSPYTDVVGAADFPLTPPANQLEPQNGNFDQQRFINEPSNFTVPRLQRHAQLESRFWEPSPRSRATGPQHENGLSDVSFDRARAGCARGRHVRRSRDEPTGAHPAAAASRGNRRRWPRRDRVDQHQEVDPGVSSCLLGRADSRVAGRCVLHARVLGARPDAADLLHPDARCTPLWLRSRTLISTPCTASGPALRSSPITSARSLISRFGGRWSENKQSANESTSGLLLASPPNPPTITSGDSTDTDFTYSIAPRWHVSSDTMVYGRIATGYRPGGPNDLPPTVPARRSENVPAR